MFIIWTLAKLINVELALRSKENLGGVNKPRCHFVRSSLTIKQEIANGEIMIAEKEENVENVERAIRETIKHLRGSDLSQHDSLIKDGVGSEAIRSKHLPLPAQLG